MSTEPDPEYQSATAAPPSSPLDDTARRRGRRLAISSHPAGMTFAMVFTQHLPTLALVSLGASEAVVGLQSASRVADLLRLPTLRAVAWLPKRTILVLGQLAALVTALPLLFFPLLAGLAAGGSELGVWIAVASMLGVTACITVSETVWFPLLRSYVEPDRIGRFFGALRSGWHLALIVYYLAAQWWLQRHPGDFAPLFVLAWLCGVARVFAIARLPERSERTGERIRIREALALVRTDRRLRRYLTGVSAAAAIRTSVIPFLLVMLRREVGFSASEILYATIASFAGGLASLYLWGRVVDRVGPAPVFTVTSIAMGIATAGLVFVEQASPATLASVVVFFFLHNVLTSGFGVADTRVLFELTPPEAPARTLVIGAVVVSALSSLAPLLSGLVINDLLETAETRLDVYHGFFALMAALQMLVFLPLRPFKP